MNKRIVSLLLCFVMVFSMLATAVPAYAVTGKTTTLTVTADKTGGAQDPVYPGDTITYTVTLGKVEALYGIIFGLDIPEGLSFVTGSGKVTDGLQAKLNAALVGFTEGTLYFAVGSCNYTSAADTVLMTFQCKVGNDLGDKTVGIILDPDELYDTDYDNITTTIVPAVVEVSAKPVAVTGVSFDEESKNLSLKTGDTKQLNWTVEPANASDTSVIFSVTGDAVTVDANGLVKAVKEGTATITIKAGNFSDTCTVKVDCSHANKTPVAAKTPDCKNQGWDAYSKCDVCGQLFNENGGEIDAIPFRTADLNDPSVHTGGTATCTAKAVCTRCGQPYGDTLDHSYTAQEQKKAAEVTAPTCHTYGVYRYSCAACHAVEANNDTHTFTGTAFDETNHDGQTTLIGVVEMNHKNQVDGYTGDTKCLGCMNIIDYGQDIPAGAHQNSTEWYGDGVNHWKICTVDGCGVVIENTKVKHTASSTWSTDGTHHWKECVVEGCGKVIDSTKTTHTYDQKVADDEYKVSDATCTSAAVYNKSCICGAEGTETFESGNPKPHTPSTEWYGDGVNHWKICTVDGCGAVIENTKGAHAESSDWSTDGTHHWKVCSVGGCGKVIDSTKVAHNYNQQVADDDYLVSGATCTSAATYYKSCVCGVASTTETFASGSTVPHTPSTEWSSDGTHHWKTCAIDGCGAVIENTKVTHTESAAWSTNGTHHWKTCTVCGEKITATEAEHLYNTAWDSNTMQHWHSCVCGDKKDLGDHVDTDKDNKCDTCERSLYTGGTGSNVHNCYDFNSDGKCDTCNDKLNCKHPDANKDGYCDKCCASIKTIESVQTFDAGIVMYAGMAVLAATGSAAVVIGKKRKEK